MSLDHHYEGRFRSYMAALLEGDARVGQQIIKQMVRQQVPLSRIFTDYIQRGMYEIGMLWESNKISVSTEHLAASTAQILISDLYLNEVCRPRNGKRVVISCVAREFHEVGALILSNVFHCAGWDVQLLGANVPADDLMKFVSRFKPAALALSVTLPANRVFLERILESVAGLPDLDVLIGGQGVGGSDEADSYRQVLLGRYPSVCYLRNIEELEAFALTA